MVNTPRSLDDLLDLFADGGPISAQDLRDFAVSIASPVVGGGFDTLGATPMQRGASYRQVFDGTPFLPAGFGGDVALPLDIGAYPADLDLRDPADETDTYFLPDAPGLWVVRGQVVLNATGTPFNVQVEVVVPNSVDAFSPTQQTLFSAAPIDPGHALNQTVEWVGVVTQEDIDNDYSTNLVLVNNSADDLTGNAKLSLWQLL